MGLDGGIFSKEGVFYSEVILEIRSIYIKHYINLPSLLYFTFIVVSGLDV